MPGVKERQFYKDDYKTLYNSNKYSHRQDMSYNKQTPSVVKKPQRRWTNFDQEFEEFLWDS